MAAPDDAALDRLLGARSVAVVGASERPGASAGFVMRNLLAQGYRGRILPVHRTAQTVFGLPAVPRLDAIDDTPDAVLVGLPADDAVATVGEAGRLGIRGAVVLASGFAETGAEGAARQQRLRAAALAHGMAVCGPNCLGLFVPRSGLALYSSRIAPMRAGGVAVLSHSGALGIALAQSGAIGVSLLVSAGNAAVTDIPDYLHHAARDEQTRVAVVVVEGIADPPAFAAAAQAMQGAGKPVIVLRAGRSAPGAAASAAHTGALAGSDEAHVAFFARIGALFAEDVESALQTAAALSAPALCGRPRPRAPGVALVGVSGGGLAHASDLADAAGLDLPALAPATVARLRTLLPPFATPQNPLDLTGIVFGNPDVYTQALAALADDPAIGVIGAVQDIPAGLDADGAAEYAGIADALSAFAAQGPVPLLIMSHLAAQHPDISERLDAAGTSVARGGRAGITALRALAAPPSVMPGSADAPLTPDPAWTARLRQGPLSEREAKLFLAAHGLQVTREHLATTADDAAVQAARLGFPVALKIESPDIRHKTEAGGVRLGLTDADAVRASFRALMADVARHAPQARIDGVLVQDMVSGGVEAFVGTTRDPTFGPVLVLGSGGILVELTRDTRLAHLPLDITAAQALIRSTRLAGLLDGWRGAPPADEDALAALAVRLGAVALAYRDVLDAIDLNPVMVLPRGRGVRIVDALVIPRTAPP